MLHVSRPLYGEVVLWRFFLEWFSLFSFISLTLAFLWVCSICSLTSLLAEAQLKPRSILAFFSFSLFRSVSTSRSWYTMVFEWPSDESYRTAGSTWYVPLFSECIEPTNRPSIMAPWTFELLGSSSKIPSYIVYFDIGSRRLSISKIWSLSLILCGDNLMSNFLLG